MTNMKKTKMKSPFGGEDIEINYIPYKSHKGLKCGSLYGKSLGYGGTLVRDEIFDEYMEAELSDLTKSFRYAMKGIDAKKRCTR